MNSSIFRISFLCLWLNLIAIQVKNVQLFSSGDCSAAPHDIQCTLCQTAGIKQASCSSPAAFRCREKSFHFLSVSVWVCGAEGPAVDRLSWLCYLCLLWYSHRLFLLLLKLLWFHLCTEIYIFVSWLIVVLYLYHMLTMCERMKWQLIPLSSVLSSCRTSVALIQNLVQYNCIFLIHDLISLWDSDWQSHSGKNVFANFQMIQDIQPSKI